GVPLRVGVAFGQLYADTRGSILVGPALVEAYEIEESQEWIGCGAGRSCCAQALEPLVEYEVPVKAGKAAVPYALDWTIIGRVGASSKTPWNPEVLLRPLADAAPEKAKVKYQHTLEFARLGAMPLRRGVGGFT